MTDKRSITFEGKTYQQGDTIEWEMDGEKHNMTLPDLEALPHPAASDELSDEQLDAVSGGSVGTWDCYGVYGNICFNLVDAASMGYCTSAQPGPGTLCYCYLNTYAYFDAMRICQ